MTLVVTGYARHGKDTVCEMMVENTGMRFTSSSMFVAEKAVRPWLSERGITYDSFDEMYADRVNHRTEWFNAIADYCKDDAARLGRELFAAGNDIYCGLRNKRELDAMRTEGLVGLVIWVDASLRMPPEDSSSMTISPDDCDIVIKNNGTVEDLKRVVQFIHR